MTISPLTTGCNATEFTALFAPEPKLIVASRLPSAPVPLYTSRTMRLRPTPPKLVKSPPAKRKLPTVSSATEYTAPFGPVPGLNTGSTDPSPFKRAK